MIEWTLADKREWKAFLFDMEWRKNHVPISKRVVKVDGKYIVNECPHCIEFDKELKHG